MSFVHKRGLYFKVTRFLLDLLSNTCMRVTVHSELFKDCSTANQGERKEEVTHESVNWKNGLHIHESVVEEVSVDPTHRENVLPGMNLFSPC